MISWLIVLAAGVTGAVAAYAHVRAKRRWWAAGLRAVSVASLVALALNTAIGARRTPSPLVALDVSSSWRRGRDASAFDSVARRARDVAGDSLYLFGDSLRLAGDSVAAGDKASRVRPAAERAMAAGRPLVLFTDGELDDPDALRSLPAGSRIELGGATDRPDAAVLDVRAPRVATAGDSVEVRVTIGAGSGGAPAGTLTLDLGGRSVAMQRFDSLPALGERTVTMRFVAPAGQAPTELRAAINVPQDGEPGNDASSAVVELTAGAAAVLVSTSPDLDSRELAALLRGTVLLPTRAYFRVAPGEWRDDVKLQAVSEDVVRRAVREAPVVVIHGDTALFGAPRAATRGALALVAPPQATQGEWFATGAPISPVSTPLSGTAWDSLPPLDVSAGVPADAEFEMLVTRRSRRLDARVAIVGWERPRRIVVAAASGFWRWRVRGGVGSDAFTAVWGSILDWLAGERADVRAAFPVEAAVRAGEGVQWRRGATGDSLVRAVLVRRGTGTSAQPSASGAATSGGADSIDLRFGAGANVTQAVAPPPGVYDVRTAGGNSLLVVNPSAELLPRRRTVQAGAMGSGATLGEAPRARDVSWLFAIALVALCAEWLLRRRIGLR
ncbi:MAG: hypothetical protein IT359_06180 [Gemmatimonadaceae bacterium]|nr:hypothetical protein [Gemmatimonadaceae bacterium]